jgi:hypothetical protein
VHRLTRQSIQDQQLQRALQQVRALICHEELSPLARIIHEKSPTVIRSLL